MKKLWVTYPISSFKELKEKTSILEIIRIQSMGATRTLVSFDLIFILIYKKNNKVMMSRHSIRVLIMRSCFVYLITIFCIGAAVIHPFAEHISYFLLFAIPKLTLVFTNTASVAAMVGYVTYIDFMNNMGHCNFEIVPKWLFHIIPPLKYLMYTPS